MDTIPYLIYGTTYFLSKIDNCEQKHRNTILDLYMCVNSTAVFKRCTYLQFLGGISTGGGDEKQGRGAVDLAEERGQRDWRWRYRLDSVSDNRFMA